MSKKETEKKRQEKVQKTLDAVFDELFGKKREEAEKKRNTRMKKQLGERSGDK